MENLSTFLIPAPLSALLTLISGISFVIVFDFYGRKIFRSDELVLRPLYFFGGLLCLGWMIWMICLAKIASVLFFKILLWIIIAHGCFLILMYRKNIALQLPLKSLAQLHLSGKKEIYFSWLLKGILVAYGLLCLTVPTDADSLNYHLALPVDILNSGSLWFNKDYLCFRMAGFGEMINIIGVANGCPQLGAFIQMIALFWILAVFLHAVPQENRITLLTAFLAIPVLLFLLPNQKHQLTGILCTSFCFFVLSEKKDVITPRVSSLLIALLFFAAGIKYSFLISAAVLLLLMAWNCQSRSEIFRLAGKIILWFLIILGPVLIFRWIHLGDPLSPFLERFKIHRILLF
jgi:hypothetical protein